jgi:hypothetical protein
VIFQVRFESSLAPTSLQPVEPEGKIEITHIAIQNWTTSPTLDLFLNLKLKRC